MSRAHESRRAQHQIASQRQQSRTRRPRRIPPSPSPITAPIPSSRWNGSGHRDGSRFKISDLSLWNTTTLRMMTPPECETMGKLNMRKDCGWDPPTAIFPKIKSHSWASRSDERHPCTGIIKGTTSISLHSLFWWEFCRNKVSLQKQMSSPRLYFSSLTSLTSFELVWRLWICWIWCFELAYWKARDFGVPLRSHVKWEI